MKWHRIILFLLSLFCVLAAPAQKIVCERMVFDLYNFDSEDEPGLKVNAVIKVKRLKNDTLILKTNVQHSFLGPQNLKADLIHKNGNPSPLRAWIDIQTAPSQSGDVQQLKVLLPGKRKGTMRISYNVVGYDFFFWNAGQSNESFGAYQSERESVYPMNLPIKEVQVVSPDSVGCFLSYKREKGAIRDIDLYFMLYDDYYKKTINRRNCNVNIYVPDTLRNDDKMRQNIESFDRHLDRLSAYLPFRTDTDIFYINWRDDKERRAFGRAVGDRVICDIHFGDKDLLHEFIHTCLPVDVESPSKGEYFMKESIIEWLALFLSNRAIDTSAAEYADSISLYDIQINNHATWNTIYGTGPAIIQRIASECGEEKMADLIISFIRGKRNKTVNYDQFVNYLSRHLPRGLVDEMTGLVSDGPTD